MAFSLLKLIHLLSTIVVFASLGLNAAVLKSDLTLEDLKNLWRVQVTFWFSIGITCLCGIILLFFVGKPSQYYSNSPLFTAKLIAFISVILLAFPVTTFLFKARESLDSRIQASKVIRLTTKAVFLPLAIAFLLATLVARGIGLR
jgi:putative membrane protein